MEYRFDPSCFDRALFEDRKAQESYLPVDVGAFPSWSRGALNDYVIGRIEDQLAKVDALPRSGSVPREFRKQFEDQLYRARLLGFDGFALDLGSLEAVACDGVLRSDDSRSLQAWLELRESGALRLCLARETEQLLGFDEPRPIARWFRGGAVPDESAPAREVVAQVEPPALDAAGDADAEGAALAAIETPVAAGSELDADELPPEPPPEELITRRKARPREASTRQIALFVENDDAEVGTTVSDEVSHVQRLRDWSGALDGAGGTTSFDALEELYVSAYSPLESALCDDVGHGPQHESLSRWALGFEQCYRAAFDRLRTSRQRPRMVFDAPKLAFQLGRSCDASGFELVLVDAFRFDVGTRVHDKLRLQLHGQAECVERGVLWSPLPSTTAAGLELLARGADGLRDLRGDLKEASVVSIKEARKLRKLRAGPHSLFKLDAVQVLLEPGKGWDRRGLDQLAAEVSVSAARFIRQQPRGMLVFLFGDHGFRLEDGSHGGASPSEVLVPYQAWHVVGRAREVAAE